MALEDVVEGGIGPGLAIAGALVLAPTLGRLLRPLAKTAIKGGMMVYRETLAGVGDVAGDIFAEARAELDEESRSTSRRATSTAKSSS
jgi:hypothetical protein